MTVQAASGVTIVPSIPRNSSRPKLPCGMRCPVRHDASALGVGVAGVLSCRAFDGQRIKPLLHWRGGDHTEIDIPKHAIGQHRHSSDAETVQIITETARLMPDRDVTMHLNRLGRRTERATAGRRQMSGAFAHTARFPHTVKANDRSATN